MTKITCEVVIDSSVKRISELFDYNYTGKSEHIIPEIQLPSEFNIGLIVGPSGSGKTQLLNTLGTPNIPEWNQEKAIVSHFDSVEEAFEKFLAVGLNSVPTWVKPFHVLSNGEKFRANLARQLGSSIIIDEFTSVIDRNVAKSCSYALNRYITKNELNNIVFASCHYDIIDWLQPDWVFDTSLGEYLPRGSLQSPEIMVELYPATTAAWSIFSKHHYLTERINNSARCWIAVWNDTLVGFTSILAFPHKYIKNGWREHRTVVLPDFQGLGIGVRLSDTIGEIILKNDGRFFSKTSHPRMGEYREYSNKWKPTSKNKMKRTDYYGAAGKNKQNKQAKNILDHAERVCYSHEYIGV